jgi:L-lactate dehydrogenase complex protein LldG
MPDKVRNTREIILDRIRIANGDGPATTFAPSPINEWRSLPREYRRAGTLDKAARTALFAERLEEYNAGVFHSDEAELKTTISSILRERGKKTILVPDGFQKEWIPEDVRVIDEHNSDEKDIEAAPATDTENVITTCIVAIAATGTVVLQHGAGEGMRLLSLLPDYHLCIVREKQIVETVPEAFDALAATATQPTTFISGPSATADIEMTRIKGVHGPRFLDVVIVK